MRMNFALIHYYLFTFGHIYQRLIFFAPGPAKVTIYNLEIQCYLNYIVFASSLGF